MKARYAVFVLLAAFLGFSLASCGGKKETSETAPSAPAVAPTPIDMSTVGSVSGTVKLDGTAPAQRKINMAAEPSCAAQHPTPATEEEVVTGAGGALANVIVYVKDGLGDRAFEKPAGAVTIDQRGCIYGPHVVALQAGQPLAVINSDKTTHNIHPVPKLNREWNESQPPGTGKIEKTFGREEVTIPVKCNVHP